MEPIPPNSPIRSPRFCEPEGQRSREGSVQNVVRDLLRKSSEAVPGKRLSRKGFSLTKPPLLPPCLDSVALPLKDSDLQMLEHIGAYEIVRCFYTKKCLFNRICLNGKILDTKDFEGEEAIISFFTKLILDLHQAGLSPMGTCLQAENEAKLLLKTSKISWGGITALDALSESTLHELEESINLEGVDFNWLKRHVRNKGELFLLEKIILDYFAATTKILRFASASAWNLLDEHLRQNSGTDTKKLWEPPYWTRLGEGVTLTIQVQSLWEHVITQEKTYVVYNRSDPSSTFVDKEKPLAFLQFELVYTKECMPKEQLGLRSQLKKLEFSEHATAADRANINNYLNRIL